MIREDHYPFEGPGRAGHGGNADIGDHGPAVLSGRASSAGSGSGRQTVAGDKSAFRNELKQINIKKEPSFLEPREDGSLSYGQNVKT